MTAATSQKLADVLRSAGLEMLAKRAEADEFHDYLSQHAAPISVLVAELDALIQHPTVGVFKTAMIVAIRGRVIDDEFEASKEEAEAWASSPEGQAAFEELTGRKTK